MTKKPKPIELFLDDSHDPKARKKRILIANKMANSIAGAINVHAHALGEKDPLMGRVLVAALLGVIAEIDSRVDPLFGLKLACCLQANKKYWAAVRKTYGKKKPRRAAR